MQKKPWCCGGAGWQSCPHPSPAPQVSCALGEADVSHGVKDLHHFTQDIHDYESTNSGFPPEHWRQLQGNMSGSRQRTGQRLHSLPEGATSPWICRSRSKAATAAGWGAQSEGCCRSLCQPWCLCNTSCCSLAAGKPGQMPAPWASCAEMGACSPPKVAGHSTLCILQRPEN